MSSSRASKVTYGGTNSKKYIVIHETANEDVGANAQVHANLQSNGFSESWNYQVDEHGAIQSFSDNAQTWHAGSKYYNQNSIGIEICVNSDGNYSKAVDNAIELVKHLMKKYNISASNVVPHQKTATWNKECPRYLLRGRYISWNTFKKRIGGTSSGVTSSSSGKSSSSKPKAVKPKAKLSVDGKWGQQLTGTLQRHYGTPQDGILSGQYDNAVTKALYGGIEYGGGGSLVVKKLQADVGVKADGLIGPATVKALQVALGSGADGVISRPSSAVVKLMQKQLNDKTFNPKGKVSKPKAKPKSKKKKTKSSKKKANLSVDGKWGKGVTKALQAHFGTPQDGILSGQSSNSATKALYGGVAYGRGGSLVVKKLQSYVGVKADGLLGPATVKALQAKLGTGQDGIISRPSSGVVKALQKKLNNGTF